MNKEKLEEADWLFRKMTRKFIKERDKILVGGINLPALLILHKIIREGPQSLGDLAEELDFTTGAITAVCDNLEKKGLATRIRGEDRRRVFLAITKEGRELYLRNQNIGYCCSTLLFDGINEERLEQQIEGYKKIIKNLEHFSEVILELAKENEKQKDIPEIPRESKYLSY
ncbi:MarR family winged helix-turn-helix transcriptional regulator [Konateibacter massiliensis]|uniref:MarR family winged helix-turn-helix transcriptional regulator n=1 Tax=Konateibacter massiliensis TaxID=2002841 RepID=UPI000C1578AF|nr:MarR family transcriptional regulator [Konateibacter massiliensis]